MPTMEPFPEETVLGMLRDAHEIDYMPFARVLGFEIVEDLVGMLFCGGGLAATLEENTAKSPL